MVSDRGHRGTDGEPWNPGPHLFPAGRGAVMGVVVALAVAFAFGAVDQYLGALHFPFLTEVSGMSAPWLLVPFLAGAFQAGVRRAAVVGFGATWLAVLAYVLMIVSPWEGTHLGPRPAGLVGSWNQLTLHLFLVTVASQWLWFAAGLVTGPVYGWLGYRWHAWGSAAAALVAVAPVMLESAARWLVASLAPANLNGLISFSPSIRPAALAETVLGLALTVALITATVRARASSAASVAAAGRP